MITLIDGAPTRLELPDGDWIEVRDISFEDFIGVLGGESTDKNAMAKKSKDLLPLAIVNWSLEEPCTKENISKLGTRAVMIILPVVQAFYMPNQKKSETSGQS